MISSIRKELSFENVTSTLKQIREVEAQSQAFLSQIDHSTMTTDYHLHCLFLILRVKWNQRKMSEVQVIFMQNNIIGGLINFVEYYKGRAMGTFTGVSDESVEQILGLVYMNLVINADEKEQDTKSLVFQNIRQVLQPVHGFIYFQSRNPKLKQRFLECLCIYRRQGEIVNDIIFSEELAKNANNINQFVDFFIDYFGKVEIKKPTVVEYLLRGLTLRLNTLMQSQSNRNQLANTLLALSKFLSQEPSDSEWVSNTLRWSQNSKIFDTLLQMTSKNQNYMKLAQIVNRIVEIYMRSRINNFTKFQFISKIFKYIIQRSSSFYTFIKTNALAEDKEFLRWFIRTELKEERGKEIISLYFSSSFALEFLLIVMIYYCDSFPQQAETVYAFMTNFGFLEQSKQFINYESVRHYLEVFHMQTNRYEEFNDFANSIQDRINLSNFD